MAPIHRLYHRRVRPASILTPKRRRHVLPLIDAPSPPLGRPLRVRQPLDGVANEWKWNVSAAAFMVNGNIKHESQPA